MRSSRSLPVAGAVEVSGFARGSCPVLCQTRDAFSNARNRPIGGTR